MINTYNVGKIGDDWPITCHSSKTVQDRDIITMEGKEEVEGALSNNDSKVVHTILWLYTG